MSLSRCQHCLYLRHGFGILRSGLEEEQWKFLSFLVALGCVMKDSSSLYRAASLDFAVHDDGDNEKITSVGGDELNSLCL